MNAEQAEIFPRRYLRCRRLCILWLSRLLIRLLALCCERCHKPGLSLLCASCAGKLPRIGQHCRSCITPVFDEGGICGHCLQLPAEAGVDVLTVRWQFQEHVQSLVWRAKFQADRAALQVLATEARRLARTLPFSVDAVLPMPIAPARLRRRGFNQTIFLAHPVSRILQVPIAKKVLYRYDRMQQSRIKKRTARLANIRGAFYAPNPVPARILLVDDVFTSGATVNEAARTLKAAGASFVAVLVIAAS